MALPGLVIFDVDGTLLQTDLVTVPAVRTTFARFGLPVPEEAEIRSFFGRPVAEYDAWLVAQCPDHLGREVLITANALELALIGETGRLYPGARGVLDGLRDTGYALAVCSNGPDDYVNEFVRAYGLESHFAAVYSRGARSFGKPEMVRQLRAEFPDLPTVVVGDRADDIEAAHANGAKAVAAMYGFGAAAELTAADELVATPLEILAAVARLLGQ